MSTSARSSSAWLEVLQHPGAFTLRVLQAFRKNQGLLLAGGVAYYALLSIVPLLLLIVIALSHLIDQAMLLETLERYMGWLFPGQSKPIVTELAGFLEHREVVGWVMVATMLFFSSLAFTVLENAMSIIFFHRVAVRRRHFLVSAILPYCYILFLGIGLLVVTLVAGSLQTVGEALSGFLLYLLGVAGEVLIVTAIYLVMPVGRLSFRHALIGGVIAALLWEITRHAFIWYFARLSKLSVVYGSLTTAIVVLITLEIAAALLLLGAQVISEYERIGKEGLKKPPKALHTG
jgi:membrane protein